MANKPKLTNPEKAAVLIRFLGEEVAAKILEKLNDREIKKVALHMGKLDLITPEMIRVVIDDFMRMAASDGGVLEGGSSYVRKVLGGLLGKEKTDRLIREMALPDDGADALSRLRGLDPQSLSSLCANEHPQTVALILVHLETSLAAEVLQVLPERLQGDVVARMCSIEGVNPEIITEIAEVMQDQIETMGISEGMSAKDTEMGGVGLVAEVLNRINRATEETVFGFIDEQNPTLVEEIKRLMFVFDDLVKVDSQGIQEILKEVSTQDLATALRTAGEGIQNKIYENMSDRAVEMLKEEMEYLGPIRLSDVEKAQQGIMAIAFKLKEEGKIFVEGGEDVLV